MNISTTTPNAQIRWTNDGTDPTAGNPSTHVITSSSGPAYGNSYDSVTFRAVAFRADMLDSDEDNETFYYDAESSGGNLPIQTQGAAAAASVDPWPTYDINGNLKTYKGWTYTYDAQNRLISATNGSTAAEFHYDGKNRQIVRNVGGIVRFSAWDNWEVLEEYSDHLNVTSGYLQGAAGVIKSWGSVNGAIYYYQDKLGSTTQVANASGALLESYKYDLYGAPTYFNASNTQISASNFGINDLYAGERWIPELTVYDLRNRFMSPELGRFLQPDPIGFKGDVSNLYRYCGNDPIDKSDPSHSSRRKLLGNGEILR